MARPSATVNRGPTARLAPDRFVSQKPRCLPELSVQTRDSPLFRDRPVPPGPSLDRVRTESGPSEQPGGTLTRQTLVTNEKNRADLLGLVETKGGLRPGVSRQIARELGVAEADVFGSASFFHLLSNPDIKVRVCMGLSCQMEGARRILSRAQQAGLPAEGCSCLAACDRPPAVLRDRTVLVEIVEEDVDRAQGDWTRLSSPACGEDVPWRGVVSGTGAMNLLDPPDYSGHALARAEDLGPEAVISSLEDSGLQGRGGAGFPASFKWKSVREQTEKQRFVVLNADEGEPGTFKDRELMLRRPDLIVEGLAIAARTIHAQEIYLYLRGEFTGPWQEMEQAIERFRRAGVLGDLKFHLHAGHGAYICGEETALLEALEGKRGMPRLKPPFPTEKGL